MSIVNKYRLSIFVMVFMLLIGCSQKSTTVGDLYIEAWTALEAYKHGKFSYIPADKNITITATKYDNQFKITATAVVQNRKMALSLTYPNECFLKKDQCLLNANKEFSALSKCVDKVITGAHATDYCSTSPLIMNNEKGVVVKDVLNTPHMDMWIYNDD